MTVTDREWLRRFAIELGVPEPTDGQVDALLDLAGIAAHSSQRTAAPISCWLVGLSGSDPQVARLAAERLAAELAD